MRSLYTIHVRTRLIKFEPSSTWKLIVYRLALEPRKKVFRITVDHFHFKQSFFLIDKKVIDGRFDVEFLMLFFCFFILIMRVCVFVVGIFIGVYNL